MPTHILQKQIVGDVVQIRHANGRRVRLATCSAHTHQVHAERVRRAHHRRLLAMLIDSIEDRERAACTVRLGRLVLQHVVRVRLRDPFLTHMHGALGVDVDDTGGELASLGAANGASEGVQLPVGIGDADLVWINEDEGSDAAASEGLDGPRANAT